jgi:signal transduction histidine kinase
LQAAFEEITQQSHRASMIVRALRDLVRRKSSERLPTDLNALVRESVLLTQPTVTSTGIELRCHTEARLPLIEVDRIQIQQVILNLLQNAVDAISISNAGERLIIVATKLSSSREVSVEVSDSGPGFSTEQRQRLFEPFSSTKPQGLGLGLNISRSIIEAHRGRLSLLADEPTTTSPCGTRFAFTLPVSPSTTGFQD